MQDLDMAKQVLKKNNCTLVVVKKGAVLFQTSSSGIRGLVTAIERLGKELRHAAVADRLVGEAAAQLCAYSSVSKVFAVTLSKCGKDILELHNIDCEYETLVPHILNRDKTDLCPFEKLVSGVGNPEEAYERLKQSA